MIKILIKQIWNSRKSNGWIFTELLVIFIATWLVIDPLYTLLYQTKAFPLGCDPHNVFCINIGVISQNKDKWDEKASENEQVLRDFSTIIELIKSYPGVCAAAPLTSDFLWSGSYSGSFFINSKDTTKKISTQMFVSFTGSDYFNVFRFKDAQTKRWDNLDSLPYTGPGVFITQNAEKALFGEGEGTGKELVAAYDSKRDVKYKVLGVIENIKGMPSAQVSPCIIFKNPSFMYGGSGADSNILEYINNNRSTVAFRLADGLDENAFFPEFRRILLSKLSIGNLYVSKIRSLESLHDEELYFEKVPTTITLQITLTLFFMINISLAVFATFWLRIKKRRSDIGLMMVVGSTKSGVRNYFMAESILIFGMSVIVGVIILIQIIYFKGLYAFGYVDLFTSSFGDGWPINNYFAHFAIVTIMVVIIEGITVLLGTWFSVRNASKILPADALREE